MAKASASNDLFDACITCSSKYNRVRPSLCQCKHCSNPFCFDCMKDHNDDLQQNIAQVSNRYNELKDLINQKRKLITDETIKSKEQISQWLKKYMDNLIIEIARINADIDKAEKEAQETVRNIEVQLQTSSVDIETFTKSNIFQSEKMEKLLNKFDEFIQQLPSLSLTRDYDLPSIMPKYKLKFNCSPQPTADNSQRTTTPSKMQDLKESKTTEQTTTCEQIPPVLLAPNTTTTRSEASNAPLRDVNYFSNRDKFEPTSYEVDCMASDGINIMYSSIGVSARDTIAYCYLDINDDNYDQADPSRPWLISRIVDMIWWKSIDKFVCATEKGIFTVEYVKKHFKILKAIKDNWTNLRIAANTNNIWIHVMDEIMIYNTNFMLVRSIDFNIPNIITRESFCVTDNLVVFLVIRGDQIRSNILKVQFYDTNMVKTKAFDVGSGIAPCMIRTDGADCFYMTSGKQLFHVRSSKGYTKTIGLENEASCLAVVNSQNIVFTKSSSELELLKL